MCIAMCIAVQVCAPKNSMHSPDRGGRFSAQQVCHVAYADKLKILGSPGTPGTFMIAKPNLNPGRVAEGQGLARRACPRGCAAGRFPAKDSRTLCTRPTGHANETTG
jgi:hypothetical protein